MSYYKQHAFFCCNNRNGERASCEDHGARTLRNYAKQRIKDLGLAGLSLHRRDNPGSSPGDDELSGHCLAGSRQLLSSDSADHAVIRLLHGLIDRWDSAEGIRHI